MKVFILTGEPFPNGMASTNRIKCYARAIQEGGLDCEVIVFRRTEIFGQKPKNTEGQGTINGTPFHYIGDTPLREKNIVIRHINDRLDHWKTKEYLKQNLKKGDVLFLYLGKHVKFALKCMKVAHKKGAFCVRDLCELPYGTGTETESAKYLRKITFEQQFPKLDGIISISEALLDLAKLHALPTCKHIKVPIMVDFDNYSLPDKSEQAEFPYIFHSGTLYQQKDGVLGMIEAFGKASEKLEKNAKFVFTRAPDRSPHKDEINNLITQYHLEEKIRFTGYLSDDELKDYLSKAKMVIINKFRTQQNNYCFSTKLGEYLAAAKPVVMTNVGEAINWLEHGKSAYIVEAKKTEELANAIVYVFTHPEDSRQVGLAGQEVCRQCFDYRNWSKPLVEFLIQLGDKK